MVMPHMDGAELIRAFKELEPSVKILAVSGRLEDEALDRLIATGEILFLSKPFSSEKLLTRRGRSDVPDTFLRTRRWRR